MWRNCSPYTDSLTQVRILHAPLVELRKRWMYHPQTDKTPKLQGKACPWDETKMHLIVSLHLQRSGVCGEPHNCYYSHVHSDSVLGRSNGQRELNPFLFQAELPPTFWPLVFWVLVRICENGVRLRVAAANEGWLQIRENKCGINLPFPEGAVKHSSAHIDKGIAYHQNVFILVNKCSSLVNCKYSIHFSTTISVIDVLHTHKHTHIHHIRPWDRSSVRHIISYVCFDTCRCNTQNGSTCYCHVYGSV